jgi:hypothetical protein
MTDLSCSCWFIALPRLLDGSQSSRGGKAPLGASSAVVLDPAAPAEGEEA